MYLNNNTKKITTTAMLAAIAYVVVVIGRIPVVLFLKYDPKDIIITLGGLIWGPLTSFIVSVIVSMIEMVTISENGILGCIMNIVSSCSFACTTAVCHFHRQAGNNLEVHSYVASHRILLTFNPISPILLSKQGDYSVVEKVKRDPLNLLANTNIGS